MSQCLSREVLRAFLSDTLSPGESALAAEHLKGCSKCQDEASLEADDLDFRQEFLDPLRRMDSKLTASAIEQVDDVSTLPTDVAMDSPAKAKIRPAQLGRYQLRQEIGRGGIGEVWEAYDTALKRSVAIKLIRNDRDIPRKFLQGLLDEGQKLASLRHAGIVDIYDVGEHEDQVYIVTELLTGGSLAKRILNAKLSNRESAALIAHVARAAHALHSTGLIHRDIKPANIILDAEGNPRLSDFGLAVSVTEPAFELSKVDGTVPYMSPEQATGRKELSAASDIYSIGVVFYQLLTGVLPHWGMSASEILRMIQAQQPVPPKALDSKIPEELNRICLKCLEKSPTQRFASAAELADVLEQWLSRQSVASTQLRRLAFAVVLLVIVVVGWSLRTTHPPNNNLIPSVDAPRRINVLVSTVPTGARIVVYPLEDRFGLPDGSGRIEAQAHSPSSLSLLPGFYLVVAALEDGRFHEVYRTVPADPGRMSKGYRHLRFKSVGDSIEWPEIEIPSLDDTKSLAQFSGADRFVMGLDGNTQVPNHERRVPPFELDPVEVTLADYRAVMTRFLPPSLENMNDDPPAADEPLQGIWWDDAVSYAERAGKRLPTEAEYEFAATNGGTRVFPWGDSEPPAEWPLGQPGQPDTDQLLVNIPVFGLYSNVPEWTSSAAATYPPKASSIRVLPIEPEHYIVRGAPHSVIVRQPLAAEFSLGPRMREALHGRASGHCVGLRCARSVRPRLQAADLEVVLQRDPPAATTSPKNPQQVR